MALGVTLNIEPAYLGLDALLAGRNTLNLVIHLLIGSGMTELCRLLLQASGMGSMQLRLLLGIGAILAALQSVLFVASPTMGSTTNVSDMFAAMPAVALYEVLFFAWIGLVLGFMCTECWRRDKVNESSVFRTGFSIFGVGCVSGILAVLLKLVLIALEVFRISGKDPAYEQPLTILYRTLLLIGIACFAAGFTLPCFGRIRTANTARKYRAGHLNALRPTVGRLLLTPSGLKSSKAAGIPAIGAQLPNAALSLVHLRC